MEYIEGFKGGLKFVERKDIGYTHRVFEGHNVSSTNPKIISTNHQTFQTTTNTWKHLQFGTLILQNIRAFNDI